MPQYIKRGFYHWTLACMVSSHYIAMHSSSLILSCLPGNRFKRDHGRILLTCAWTYAAIFAFSPLAHWGEYGEEPYGTACCIDWHSANVSVVAMSYIVAVFIFCFILPCGVIVTSYTLILITVKESRKAVEQHISGTTRMSNMQAITIKVFLNFSFQVTFCVYRQCSFRVLGDPERGVRKDNLILDCFLGQSAIFPCTASLHTTELFLQNPWGIAVRFL